MAQRLLRLRRTLTPHSSTRQRRPSFPDPMAIAPPAAQTPPIISQWRGFSGTRVSMTSTAAIAEKQYWVYENLGEITENKTLFEGCAYNYWLVTVDFPKEEPKPSPREMIAAYERICAQGLNSSIEEAKKRIYACSTTTFQGFQVLMTEQESEKFRDVPKVVFVLPDSPGNKEYEGDEYEHRMITPGPTTVQFQRGGERCRDQGRIPPRFDQRDSPIPNNQGLQPQNSQQGRLPGGGGNYRSQQNGPPQQNHGPPGLGGRMPMNNRDYAPGGRNMYPGQQGNHDPPGQQGYNHGQQRNHYPAGGGGNHDPPGQQGYNHGQQRNHHPQGQGYNQVQQGNHYAPDQRSFPQGDWRDHGPHGQRDYKGDNWNYSPTHGGNYGQGGIPPRFDQRESPIPNYHGLQPQYSQQGCMQGGGSNYGYQQNGPPQQNHGPPGLGGRMLMNNRDYAPGGRNMYPGQQGNHDPPGQQGYNEGEQVGGSNYRSQQNGPPQQNHGPPGLGGRMLMNNRDYAPGGRNMYPGQQGNRDPPGQQGYNHGQQRNHYPPGGGGNHDPPGQQGYNHGQQRNHYPQGQGYNQGQQGNHYAPDQRSFPQGDWRDHGPPGQRDYKGDNGNYSPTHGGNYGQGGVPPRFDQRESPIPNYHRLQPQYSQQGCMQGGGSNYGSQQNGPPQPNHGPPGLGGRMLMNNRDYAPGGRNMYPGQQGYNEGEQGGGRNYRSQQNGPPQQNHGPPWRGRMPMNNRDYAPGERNTYPGQHGNRDPPGQQGYNQGEQRSHYPPGQQGYNPEQQGNHYPPGQRYNQGRQGNHYPPGQQGYFQRQQGNHYDPDQRSFTQGDWRDHESPGQRDYRGDNWNYSPTHGGNYGQGGNSSYGQRNPGEGQRSAQMEQMGMQGEQGNYAPLGPPGWSNQGRY